MTTVAEWDEWFRLTGDEETQRAWEAAKLTPHPLGWAKLIELQRVSRVNENARLDRFQPGAAGQG